MKSRTLLGMLVLFISLVICRDRAVAQPAADLGRSTGAPTSVYHGTDLEQVDTSNGNLHISLPLVHLPGRGLDMNIVLSYNSKVFQSVYIPSSDGGATPAQIIKGYDQSIAAMGSLSGGRGIGSPGWSVGVPRMGYVGGDADECLNTDPNGNCAFDILHYTFVANDGTRLSLVDQPLDAGGSGGGNGPWSFDGSFALLTSRGLTYKDGVVAGSTQSGGSITSETLTDVNGNFISCSFANGNPFPNPTGCTDTLGRHITYTSDPVTGLAGSMLYTDSSGASRAVTFQYTPFTLNYPFSDSTFCFDRGVISPPHTYLLTSVTLANGLQYSFQYFINADGSSTGEITKIILPTGGYIRYEYGFGPASTDPHLGLCSAQGSAQSIAQNRMVVNRFVSPDGTSASEQRWSYALTALQDVAMSRVMTVTDPQLNSQVYSRAFGSPLPYQTDYKDASGHLLRSVLSEVEQAPGTSQYLYASSAFVNARYKSLITILPDTNQQSKTTFTYGAYNNIIEQDETDWGNGAPGPVLRKTTFTYLQDTNSAYAADLVHIFDRPATQNVCNAGGTFCAQTTTTYDNYGAGLTPTTNVAQHDYTNYSATNTTRGNPTQITRTLAGGNVVTQNKYNDVGNVLQVIDPNNNPTSFTYTDNFANGTPAQPTSAYVTQITRPSTNGVNHIQRAQFYFNTGLTSASCGENFPSGTACVTGLTGIQPDYQSMTYERMGRPLVVTRGDGGSTTFTYNEASLPINVGTSTTIDTNPSHLLTQTTVYDGLGRLSQTQLTSDPGGTDYQLTTYDPLGRKSQVFNPTRCNPPGTNCGEATWGYTSFTYDGLGRPIRVTSQDGGVLTTTFSGNTTTVTDQAGKPRKSMSDGLGRLVEVDEPGGTGASGAQATASVTVSGSFNSAWTGAGTPHLAAAGSALASVTMSDGSSHNFYFDTNQHLMQLWGIGTSWSDQDLTAQTEAPLPMAGSALSAVFQSGTIHVFYQGANQHIYNMNWTGSAWQNLDLTALTGATAASGTRISALVGGPNSPMAFYQGTNQHFYIVYWASSINAWSNADLSGVPGVTTLVATNSGISSGAYGPGLYGFYVATNQHVITIYWSGTAWTTADLTALSGGALAATGSSLTTTVPNAGATPLMTFYEGSNQHIYSSHWFTGNNSWQTADFTGATNLAAIQTSLANNPAGPHTYYFTGDQHLHDLNWNGSAWVNLDLTTLASAVVPASGSSLSSHGTSAGNPYHIFFEGANQHIYHTYYKASTATWLNEDPLIVAGHFVTDAGTVSLSIPNGTSNFIATVCYGVSTNAFCAGKPVNASSADIANALAAVLNGAGSPVNATVNGSTLNLTWRTAGWSTAAVAPMSSSSDFGSLFPSGSFTSSAGTFSGGVDPGSQSLTSPLVTLYQYDALGNLTCVEQHGTDTTGTGCSAPASSDANSPRRVRRFTYDTLSRLTSSSNPEANTATVGSSFVRVNTTYAYDPNGNLLQKTSPAVNQSGTSTQTISYCYDPLNRVTGKAYSAQTCSNGLLPTGTAVASYFYDQTSPNGLTIVDGIGRRTGMTDQAGSESWSYEAMGKPAADKRTTGTVNMTTSYLYNFLGSPTSITYPSSRTITYAYNNAGQATSAADTPNSINYATLAAYSPAGALTSLKNGTNLTSTFFYNNRLQPCRISVTTGAANPLNCADPATTGNVMDFGYSFNLGVADNGNVISIANNRDSTRSQSFAYDSLNRIGTGKTSSTTGTNCFGETFGYDAWGNLLTIGGVTGYSGCTQESLAVGANVKNQISTNLYDTPGNMTTGGYTYDAENHLLTAGGVTYTYDGDGKRVKKSTGKLYWYGMGADALDETDLAGNTNNSSFNEYVFFNGKRMARRDSTSSVFYYFADHLGTSRVMVQGGQTTPCYDADFYPFGGERAPITNTCPQNYRFTGKERDSESGLDYFGARYYGNTFGRFTSADPKMISKQRMVDPQQWNMYSYVRNNPLVHIDPDGQELKMVVFLEGGKGNETFTKIGVMRAANAIHNVGVKNVTVEFRSGTPDSKTLSGLNKDHVTVFRIQDPSEKSWAAKAAEKVFGGTTIGQSEKTTNVVHIFPTGSGFKGMETHEMSNVVKHEELHQAGESFVSDFMPNRRGNVMDPDSYDRLLADEELKIDPSYQGSRLRDTFNRANEVDSNPEGATCVGGCPSASEPKDSNKKDPR